MPQLRQNPITHDWVVIAPERSKRPHEFVQPAAIARPSHTHCAFCPGGPAYAERLPQYETSNVYVSPNKYPAFVEAEAAISDRTHSHEPFYHTRPALGGHELIIVKDDRTNLLTFSPVIWNDLLAMTQQRMQHYRNSHYVAASMPIYNYKPAAGASIDHPHAQLFATGVVPNRLNREVHHALQAFEPHGVCVFCQLISEEQQSNVRIIAETEDFIACSAFAARFPFETWVLPKRHRDRFEDEPAEILASLGTFLSQLLAKFDTKLHDPAMNMFLHSFPSSLGEAEFFHWHVELAPRLSIYGGFEMGSDMVIDSVSPEHAAEFLRA